MFVVWWINNSLSRHNLNRYGGHKLCDLWLSAFKTHPACCLPFHPLRPILNQDFLHNILCPTENLEETKDCLLVQYLAVTTLIISFNHHSQKYKLHYPLYSLCMTFFFLCAKTIKEITNNPHRMHCKKRRELLFELTRAECNIARFMLCFRAITWSSPILGRYTWPRPSSLASTTCEWT